MRPRSEEAQRHQPVVRVHHRVDAHLVRMRELPDRRQLGAGAQLAVLDHAAKAFHDLGHQGRGQAAVEREHGGLRVYVYRPHGLHSASAVRAHLYMLVLALSAYSRWQSGRNCLRPALREEPHATRASPDQRRSDGAARGRRPPRRRPRLPDLRGPRRERRGVRRRRPALHRLCRRHRRAQHRPSPPGGDRRGEGPARPLHAHRLPGAAVRALHRTGRAPQRDGARRLRQEDHLPHDGRRSRGERDQDRARPHRPAGRDRLRRRLSRPHAADAGHDGQGRAVQDRLRPLPARRVPRRVSGPGARRHGR